MRRVTVGLKIGVGFLAIGLVLLITGFTSVWVINNLSQSLKNITGPVLDSILAAETINQNVQNQLLLIDQFFAG